MDQEEARNILLSLRRELAGTRDVIEAAQRRANSLEKLVGGYIELFPGLSGDAPSPEQMVDEDARPKGQEAILKVMEDYEFKGRYWTVAQMVDELSARGWMPESRGNPANAIRTALGRVYESNKDRVYKGQGRTGALVYFYRHPGAPEPHFAGEGRLDGLTYLPVSGDDDEPVLGIVE